MKTRATKIEMEKRIFTIQGWIIEGVQDHLISKNVMQNWGLSLRQAQRLIAKSYNEWKNVEGVKIEQKRNLAIAKLQQKQRGLKDEFKGTPSGLKVLLEYDKEIHKLQGIDMPKVHVIEGNPDKPLAMAKRVLVIKERA